MVSLFFGFCVFVFFLDFNQLSRGIPTAITSLSQLRALLLSTCLCIECRRLCHIPLVGWNCKTFIDKLLIGGVCLCVFVCVLCMPSSSCCCLFAVENSFSGLIPTELGLLTKLTHLGLGTIHSSKGGYSKRPNNLTNLRVAICPCFGPLTCVIPLISLSLL